MLRSIVISLLLYGSWLATMIAPAEGQQPPPREQGGSYKDVAARLAATSHTQKKNRLPYNNHNKKKRQRQRRQIFDHETREYYAGAEERAAACRNLHADCHHFAQAGGCADDPVWMHPHCPASCGVCDRLVQHVPRQQSMEPPVVQQPHGVIVDAVGASLGVPQRLVSDEHAARILERVGEAIEYMENTVMVDELYQPVRETCQTHDAQCAYWAAIAGECESNAEFMNEHCAPVCFTCEQLHVLSRCPVDPNEKNGALCARVRYCACAEIALCRAASDFVK